MYNECSMLVCPQLTGQTEQLYVMLSQQLVVIQHFAHVIPWFPQSDQDLIATLLIINEVHHTLRIHIKTPLTVL